MTEVSIRIFCDSTIRNSADFAGHSANPQICEFTSPLSNIGKRYRYFFLVRKVMKSATVH